MSHSCERDKCSSCLWKPYHSCMTNKSQEECEASKDHQWCGSQGAKYPLRALYSHQKNPKNRRMRGDMATATVPASCGTCTNCKWVPYNACYTNWTEAQCSSYGSDYVWCGGNAPNNTPVYCCKNGQTLNLPAGSTCPQGYTPISDSSDCTTTVQCANPYYGSGSTTGSSCGLSSILPSNSTGLNRWLSIFTLLDPNSLDYASNNCGQLDAIRKYSWTAGCLMFGKGGMNGLTPFLNAAAKFPGFCSGPDPRRNIIELACFFGNVMQETVKLYYSTETGSPCPTSLFGKGPIQITGSINYQFATLGLAKPSDANILLTQNGGTLSGACAQNGVVIPADQCWADCANAQPAQPPHGAGYNYCARPWLASGVNDLNPSGPTLDPEPAWASAIWYWMNFPISNSVAKTYYNIQGDVSCATAHNLIQDPAYNCGEWCALTAIATVGCPTCCTSKQTGKVDPQTISRVGNYVKIAGILGLPEAQGTAANDYFCMLLSTCTNGSPNTLGTTCPTGISYSCYSDGSCI